ncbi:MAG: hypothetical protein F6K28_11410 [Microcoleus sp. SIO2G3]|nr:hypothetical protein [Microcoleus sp. SIO2G3]
MTWHVWTIQVITLIGCCQNFRLSVFGTADGRGSALRSQRYAGGFPDSQATGVGVPPVEATAVQMYTENLFVYILIYLWFDIPNSDFCNTY